MRPRGQRNRGGFTLIESLVAAIIMSVAIVAMFSSWGTCFKQSRNITQLTEAEEIDKAVLEIAKVYGPMNLPTGTYNSSTQTGSWSGAYIPATGWTTGGTAYYSFNGTQLASSSSTGVFFSATVAISDSGVQQGSGNSYTIQNSSLRSIVVTVSTVSNSTVVLSMATSIIVGGM